LPQNETDPRASTEVKQVPQNRGYSDRGYSIAVFQTIKWAVWYTPGLDGRGQPKRGPVRGRADCRQEEESKPTLTTAIPSHPPVPVFATAENRNQRNLRKLVFECTGSPRPSSIIIRCISYCLILVLDWLPKMVESQDCQLYQCFTNINIISL